MHRAAVLLVLLTLPAAADSLRDAVKAGVERCDAVRDERAWLDCFDKAADPMRAFLYMPRAGQSTTTVLPVQASAPPPRAVPPAPPRQGMFDDLFGPGVRLVNGLHITDVHFNSDGTFVITLEDGQAWKQNSPPAQHAHFDQVPSSYVVDIREGVLGSDDLRVRGVKQTYKVHRLR